MKKRSNARRVDGILVLDKPAGMTSNAALQRVKGVYFARKAGHTGSLDPLATGVLPLCFGEATKWSQFLLDSDKEYVATLCLGVTTDTGDADGAVLAERSAAAVEETALDAVLARFRGDIEQVPPMYSALKRGGVPLYELARKGETVEREARRVTIHALERLEFRAGERAELRLRVLASKGTYVRVLAEDIGAALGCGAHVARLHRSQAGPFRDADAITLERLEALRAERAFEELDRLLLPAERALAHLPEVRLAEASCFYLAQGQSVMASRLPAPGLVRIASEDGKFRGVGEVRDDRCIAPRRMGAT
ncbi:MAG TPA: tRNA pseudouridine(55) synthase TruB [Pseudomonadales bacterium]|nr:tRNA pseudouridine(55) synthase TruB [Pseudomonadales bacterium]HNC70444.1 tRNA pseudouridine(55) synthase TruB [Pseudomonadales bacterium]HND14144.1 tRNA pseudouridine(55) synthase TruB [Pseudomonadales bacterium]